MYTLFNIEEGLNNLMNPVKEFMAEHGDNPLVWFAIIGIGILVFFWTYSALQKEKFACYKISSKRDVTNCK